MSIQNIPVIDDIPETEDFETDQVFNKEPVIQTEEHPVETDEHFEDNSTGSNTEELILEVRHKNEFTEKVKNLMEDLSNAKDNASLWTKEVKSLNDKILKEISAFCRDQDTPLFDSQTVTDKQQDDNFLPEPEAWKQWPIGDHFSFSEKQLEKLGLTEVSPIERLSAIANRLAEGKEKIKGVGEKLKELIERQFEDFFKSDEYQNLISLRNEMESSKGDVSEAKRIIEEIHDIRDNVDLDFDYDAFLSISEQVTTNDFVTTDQIQALQNILAAIQNMADYDDNKDENNTPF